MLEVNNVVQVFCDLVAEKAINPTELVCFYGEAIWASRVGASDPLKVAAVHQRGGIHLASCEDRITAKAELHKTGFPVPC